MLPAIADLDELRRMQEEIGTFLRSLEAPVAYEDGRELVELAAAEWRLGIEFGKLIFEAWSPGRSIARRVEAIAYRDGVRLRLLARKSALHEASNLEFRDARTAALPEAASVAPNGERRPRDAARRADDRARFRQSLATALAEHFSGWKLERVSNRSHREHSFSAWYTRGVARQGRAAWAFLGLPPEEPVAAADSALVFALIWLDWLRGRAPDLALTGVKLFLPSRAIDLNAHRAAYLDTRHANVEIFEWQPAATAAPRRIDLRDFGNVETRLASCRSSEALAAMLAARHGAILRELLGDAFTQVDQVADAPSGGLSLRVLGLEVARLEGQAPPRIEYGPIDAGGRTCLFQPGHEDQFREFLGRVLRARRPQSQDSTSPFYQWQSERWLESLLVRDITRIDPALSPRYVYPQVPAFAGTDRGVIDILGVTQAGRLAVIELKVEEEINLPLQALDYWLRVKWLLDRRQFSEHGYFPGLGLSPAPPLLYLVSPAFRFHSTTASLVRSFDPAIEVMQVGINQTWREGVKVLFRREVGRQQTVDGRQ